MAEYIERDAVISLFDKNKWQGEIAIMAIEDLPAAYVAPVVHGRWGESEFGFAPCSVCGELHEVDHEPNKYCPNCGAKMDLEG